MGEGEATQELLHHFPKTLRNLSEDKQKGAFASINAGNPRFIPPATPLTLLPSGNFQGGVDEDDTYPKRG